MKKKMRPRPTKAQRRKIEAAWIRLVGMAYGIQSGSGRTDGSGGHVWNREECWPGDLEALRWELQGLANICANIAKENRWRRP